MSRLLCLWLALLLLAGLTASAEPVDFRVSEVTVNEPEGGVTRPRQAFSVGAKRISFRPPFKGRLTSSSDEIAIYLSEGAKTGEIRVTNSPFKPGFDFLAQTEDYHLAGEATLPKEADKPEVLGAKMDVYRVNGWKSMAFEWKYTYISRATHRGVTYLNLDAEHQVCVSVVSDEDFWPQAAGVARQFVMSCYWVENLAR